VKLQLEIIVVKLNEDEYFEGEVIEFNETEGVTVSFMGILEGRIHPHHLHSGSLFNGSWILPYSSDKAFTWKIGDQIRFKINKAGNSDFYIDWSFQGKRMADLISLRCNEQGLGPISWWL
jgi:DNA-directed RNA polymerase subunit E'/Rpb7